MSGEPNTTPSPFHEGEVTLQRTVGVAERLEQFGRRVIRDHMPDQHRTFYRQLPFIVLGAVDGAGDAWATLVAGYPGFMTSPDPRRLQFTTEADPADPATAGLGDGAAVGLLGIELHTRRRNRMNGTVRLHDDGLLVEVGQSFGNCPKYIQAREPVWTPAAVPGQVMHQGSGLDDGARALIRAADTFFIATAHPEAATAHEPRHGVDVSHRGGAPGFVKVEGDRLTVPDFMGNQFFNTLGNLAVHPLAGLLFMDFERGDRLYVAAHASVVWDGAELAAFAGAQRLMRLDVTHAVHVQGGLPLQWGPAERSPHLASMGYWPSR